MGVWTVPDGNAVAIAFTRPWSVPAGNQVAIPFAPDTPAPLAVNDSYGTDYGTLLEVPAPGVLANDTLNDATAALTDPPLHGELTFNPDGSFSYEPDAGFEGVDSWTYTLTNDTGTSTATVSITVGAPPPVIRYLVGSARLPWSKPAQRMRGVGSGWRHVARQRASTRAAWQAAPVVRATARLPFGLSARVRAAAVLPWGKAPGVRGSAPALPWRRLPKVSRSAGLPWGLPPFRHAGSGIPWRRPPGRSTDANLPWTTPPGVHTSARLPAQHPPLHFRRWNLPWQYAPPVGWRVHSPGVDPPDDPDDPVYWERPPGNRVAIAFQCPWHVPAGNRVAIPFQPAACYYAWPRPRTYIVENSAAVVRLPERTPIAVSSIELALSVDDVHWSMAMTLADPADLAYLKAGAGGPKVVEITINGYVWTAIVESYDQDRRFEARSVRVSGRSQTALLDAPYAQLRAKVQAEERLLQQLIDEELEFTDFTADFDAVAAHTGVGGWTVPAGVYHYDSATPIGSIRTLAAASGAVVQAHPWDQVLIVSPRYPASPWDWPLTANDKYLQEDIILRDSHQLESKPLFDYVLVSGEQAGVSDPVIRTGEAGTTRAPMVVDPLITAHAAARERGRNILGDRGEQASVAISIPLFASSVPSTPGLILPLQLVEVAELVAWKGLATAVRISASREAQGSSRSVLVVEQTVTLERHYSDAE